MQFIYFGVRRPIFFFEPETEPLSSLVAFSYDHEKFQFLSNTQSL